MALDSSGWTVKAGDDCKDRRHTTVPDDDDDECNSINTASAFSTLFFIY